MRALRISLIVLAVAVSVGGCNTILGTPSDDGVYTKEVNSVYWREHWYYAIHSGIHKPGY